MNQDKSKSRHSRGRQAQLTGPDRWQVSYADFLTLLLGFFIVMYSVQSLESEQRQAVIEALQESFSDSVLTTPKSVAQHPPDADLAESSAWLDEIPFFFDRKQLVERQGDWLYLDIASEAFFQSAQATLSPEAKRQLDALAQWMQTGEAAIEVEGHTDNVPIHNKEFSNNWSLSSARAVAIVSYLQTRGLAGERMRAIGFGEYTPVADNATEEGRQRNRRVVIKIEQDSLPPLALPASAQEGLLLSASTLEQPQTNDEQKSSSSQIDLTATLNRLKEKGLDVERKSGGGLRFRHDP